MKRLTDEQVLDLEKVYCDNLGPGIHGSRSSIEALVKAHDRIRAESVDGGLVERCADVVRKGYEESRTFREIARAVLAEASGAMGGDLGPLTEEERREAAKAGWGMGELGPGPTAAFNAVLASRRQRMVMSGGMERESGKCESVGFSLADGHVCNLPKGHDGWCASKGGGTQWRHPATMTAEDWRREGAKAAEHGLPQPRSERFAKAMDYIRDSQDEIVKAFEPATNVVLRRPAMVYDPSLDNPQEHGKGLEATALKELDRPLSSKPHTAAFGIDIYDEDP